jgi:hypothetical protein
MALLRPSPTGGNRRGFLARVAGSAVALVAGGLVAPPAGNAAERPPMALDPWDDSWVQRVTGKHRQVFDAPEIAEGAVLHQARMFMRGYAEVYGTTDADTTAVLVFRHEAIPIVLGDEAWDHYQLGKALKLKDPTTGKDARRNPFLNPSPGDKYGLVWNDGSLDKLLERGAIGLACNLAIGGFAEEHIVKHDRVSFEEAKTRAHAALLPGIAVQPSGIFAVARAQETGCNYIRAA